MLNKYTWLLFLGISQWCFIANAQDTTSFFPHQVGNLWEYYLYTDFVNLDTFQIYITSDSIDEPVFRQNRLLVPRIVFDMVENLNDRNDIAFVEYPRHQEFRGASSKSLLRSDKYKMTASLEYQWPLAYYLNGHLFYDYLTVAPEPGDFFTGKPPWAAGFGIDFHTAYSEVARLFFSFGSEGLFFKLDVGLSSLNRDRSDWK